MYRNNRVTVVIPCLNEEGSIGRVLDEIPGYADEIIVVDNNSTDRTADVARSRKATVVVESRRGYGRAYKKGFAHATGDLVIALDGDCSYPADAMGYLMDVLLDGQAAFVSGTRFPIEDKRAMSLKHRIGNCILSVAMSALFTRWIRDSQSGMWVVRRKALDQMNLVSDGMAFSEEIKIEALRHPAIGFREVRIRYSQPMGKKKLEPWKDGVRNLAFLFQKRLR